MQRLMIRFALALISLLLFASGTLFSGDPGYNPLEKSDLTVKSPDLIFSIKDDIDPIIEALGTNHDESIVESRSNEKWDFIALKYDSVEISYTRGWRTLRRVKLFEGSLVETNRGIKVGSSVTDVKKVYKDTLFNDDGNRLIAFFDLFDDLGIISTTFYLSFSYSEKGEVTEIEIGIAVN